MIKRKMKIEIKRKIRHELDERKEIYLKYFSFIFCKSNNFK